MVMAQIDLHRAAGRVDDVTQLPNHARLLEDLTDLANLFPGQDRTLLLVEAMDHGGVRDAARAIGITRVEDFLRNLALTLQRLLSEGSKLYFVGVGRFGVLTSLQGRDLDHFMDLLEKALTAPVASDNLFIELEAVVGVIQFVLTPEAAQEALRKAMTAVHQARTAGRSRMAYEQEFDVRHQRAFAILRDLPLAIANDELYLAFQPKLRVYSGLFEGVEALLRWNHPQLGNVPPGVFIPLAENTTLIHDITNWVIDAALRELVSLTARGLSVAVAVNVSARNLERPGFIADLERILARYPVMPDRLHIECTEYSRLTDPAIMEVLLRIRALGIQLSLDDFGIGFQSDMPGKAAVSADQDRSISRHTDCRQSPSTAVARRCGRARPWHGFSPAGRGSGTTGSVPASHRSGLRPCAGLLPLPTAVARGTHSFSGKPAIARCLEAAKSCDHWRTRYNFHRVMRLAPRCVFMLSITGGQAVGLWGAKY